MASIVVPFRSPNAKSRLALPALERELIATAMLADVLAAAREIGPATVADGEGGQGAAVARALGSTADGRVLVVNADLPCARPRDLLALLVALPDEGIAVVAAQDGTTNALALSAPRLFAPLYGPGSAARFIEHARQAGVRGMHVSLPALEDDVDTLEDLERLDARLGPHTRAALEALRVPAA